MATLCTTRVTTTTNKVARPNVPSHLFLDPVLLLDAPADAGVAWKRHGSRLRLGLDVRLGPTLLECANVLVKRTQAADV